MTMPEMAFLSQQKAEASTKSDREQTIIHPTQRIRTRLVEYDLDADDFGPGEFPEVIILKGKKGGFFEKSGVQQYEDTNITNQMRSDVLKTNEWLVSMEIDAATDEISAEINTNNRKLRRYFTRGDLTFSSGGRLFGGFWLEMSKKDRGTYLWLDDEPICTLDFVNLAPSILYAMVGKTPPEGDAYSLPGYGKYRSGVKTIFSTMTFTDKPLERFPKGVKKEFENNHRLSGITEAIKDKHQAISHLLNSQIGHQIQKTESDIIIKALLTAMKEDISCLPVHDALLFPKSKKEQGIRIMSHAFREITGSEGAIKEVIRLIRYII